MSANDNVPMQETCESSSSFAPTLLRGGGGFRNVAETTTTTTTSFSSYDQDATRLTCDVLCSLSQVARMGTGTSTTTSPPHYHLQQQRDDAVGAAAVAAAVADDVADDVAPPLPIAVSSFPSSISATAAAVTVADDAVHQHSLPCATTSPTTCTSTNTQLWQHQYCTDNVVEPAAKRRSSSNSNNSSSSSTIKAAAAAVATACPAAASKQQQQQHPPQLPMFLSKTYHMIDRCDPEISTWSENGESFVVKNVEQFATTVLPLYFKHANFSSFARQLNFYGFRKLRSDPILTQDVDPRTSAYIRFYHDKFQKDKPELLHHIRRATKTDQQSRDDLDYLKQEISKLQEANADMKQDFDQRLSELSYECNSRVTALNADYDKLFSLVQSFISNGTSATAAAAATNGYGIHQQQHQQHPQQQQPVVAAPAGAGAVPQQHHNDATAVALAALRDLHNTRRTTQIMPDLLHSLSHAAAVDLQNMVHDEAAASLSHPQHQQQQHQHYASQPSSDRNLVNHMVVTDSSSGSSSNGSATGAKRRAGDYVLV